MLILGLLLVFVFFKVFWGGPWRGQRDPRDADFVLRRRLAAGEISEEDYRRLRAVLDG